MNMFHQVSKTVMKKCITAVNDTAVSAQNTNVAVSGVCNFEIIKMGQD